jgi:hypothetical protein
VLIHGDAAFPGQGVVAETLNLQRSTGYAHRRHAPPDRQQPGRLHDRPERRALDALRERPGEGLRHPDHPRQRRRPEACDRRVRLAMAYRAEFGHDVVIDLVGYRRFGHNEGDEPAYTQPLMYEQIAHPTVRELYASGSSRTRASREEEADARWRARPTSGCAGARAS